MKTEMIESVIDGPTDPRAFVLVPWIEPHNSKDRAGVGCAGKTCGSATCECLGPCSPRDGQGRATLVGPHVWVLRETYEFRKARGLLAEYGYGETPAYRGGS